MESVNENQIVKALSYHEKGAGNKLMNYKLERTGETNYNKYGSKMTIFEYSNFNNIVVEFENGWKTNSKYDLFKKGTLTSPYDKTICGVGVVGLENIYPNVNLEYKKSYDKWRGMITRCYNKKSQEKSPTYKGCSVCDEWLFYPNFKEWYDKNYYEIQGEQMHLDKDILHKGNKIYSPNNCIFAPSRINTLILNGKNGRGKLPVGVNYNKKSGKYRAQYNYLSYGNTNLGEFDNPNDAFYKYKEYKEKYIKLTANEYKDKIPEKLYTALNNWQIDISD